MSRRMTNKELQSSFCIYNERFFDNRLSQQYSVSFEKIKDDGDHIPSLKKIRINSDFRKHPDVALFIMIHEMAHADLWDYIGSKGDHHHGMRFQAKLVELFNVGAYDGLL